MDTAIDVAIAIAISIHRSSCLQAQKTARSHSSRMLVAPDTQVLANAAKHVLRDDSRGVTPRRARAEQRGRDHGMLLPPPPPLLTYLHFVMRVGAVNWNPSEENCTENE